MADPYQLQAVLSYDLDKLLAFDKRTELECALTLDQPLRLGGLSMMLRAIRVEFADYKLTEVCISFLNLPPILAVLLLMP